jgi:DNA-directed RNA polymerase sigma subunit (sigma70/sigma32)
MAPLRTRTTTRNRLVQRISQLDESNDRLRDVLQRFKRSNGELSALVKRGDSVRDAIGVEVPQRRRREMTAALDAFEAARHEFRLALFVLCMEEGASISEIGRALGVSRQRASHLAAEATRTPSRRTSSV